jgi:arylsulfatase A
MIGKFTILASIASIAAAGPLAAADRPLNLLIITADDMNGDSPGWMGNPLGATPALDGFAASCHRFPNHHLTAPICQPSREALMTGRVPHRSGGLGFNPITPGTPTLTSILKARGYFTGVIEKHAHMKPDAEFPWDVKLGGSGKNPPLFRRHVEDLLGKAAEAGKPFFIDANITDPHRPWPASEAPEGEKGGGKGAKAERRAARAAAAQENLVRTYRPEEVRVPSFLEDLPPVRKEVARYYTAVARLDATFRGAIEALKAAGREGDTAVLFLSDNGISLPFAKATVYRNGTWSPVLLRWPGMGPPQRREEFVSSVDILPTLLDVLGVEKPGGLDGLSWLPLLRGEAGPDRDRAIAHVNTVASGLSFAARCIRTKDWALQFQAWPDGAPRFRVEAMSGLTFNALAEAAKADRRIAARVDQLVVGVPLALYDERADPDERVNLIGDPARRPEAERLSRALLAHMERTGDPQLPAFRKALDAAGIAAGGRRRPNVIFILADDLGYGDLGCYGQRRFRTPCIDRLAAEGMRFTAHYSGHNVCAPSRCCLMTGRHPGHGYIRDNRGGLGPEGEGQEPVPDGELKLPLTLRRLGYALGAFGKWGLGPVGSAGDPLRQGFDRFFGFNCQAVAHNYYPTHLWSNEARIALRNPPFPAHQKLPPGADPDAPVTYAGFMGIDYAPDRIGEEALGFIRSNRDRPFFLYYPTTVPHLALQVPEDSLKEYEGKFPEKPYAGGLGYLPHRTPRAAYAAMIGRLDRDVGRVLDLVKELGLDEDTLIVFASDNGPLSGGRGGTDDEFFDSAGGLRGRKGSYHEGGFRVPCLVRWKGRIAAGATSDRVTGFEDWLPTILELIGGKGETPEAIDGISFAPTLLGGKQEPRPFLYRESPAGGGQQAVRVGDWKAIRKNLNPSAKAGDQKPGAIELYDLARDPGETRDVAGEHPDVVEKLARIMKEQHVKSELWLIRALDEG